MPLKQIHVVDDDLDLRQFLVMALELEDYCVFEAGNGQEALDFLEQCKPDDWPGCILLDLMMPVMDGQTFVEVFSKEKPRMAEKIPIIIATAKGGHNSAEHLPHTAARIQKPMDLETLYRVVGNYY